MNRIPTTLPSVPVGSATAFLLSGEYGLGEFTSTRTSKFKRFREIPVFHSAPVYDEARGSIIALVRSHSTYGGEVMRCFIPRHGLRFADHAGKALDILLCLECHWIYLFSPDGVERYALSAKGREDFASYFDEIFPTAKGKSSAEILAEIPDANETRA